MAINGPQFGEFAPCHCLWAVTTEQMMLLVVVADTQRVHSCARSPTDLQLGKDGFHGRGLGEGTWGDVTPPGLPASSSPKSWPQLAPQNQHWGTCGKALGRKKEANHLGKNLSMLQSQGHSLGLAVLELHGPGMARARSPWQGGGMGQDWVSVGEPGEGCLAERRLRKKQEPAVFIVSLFAFWWLGWTV